MFGKLVSKSIDLATLPARVTIKHSMEAMDAANLIPGGLDQLQSEFNYLLAQLDTEFSRKVEDMTEHEREIAAIKEIQKAEHHLSNALISMLRLVRLATVDDSRIIEYKG